MADESTIRAVLIAHAPLTALVGVRVWDQMVPKNLASPAVRPFVLMTVISGVPYNALASAPTTDSLRIQFDIYADTKATARAVLTAVRNALHGAGHHGCEELTQDLPADDPDIRRISSDWRFVLSR